LAKEKEIADNIALGIPCGNLSEKKKERQELLEKTDFPFCNLVKTKPDTYFNLLDFYGIDYSFPSEYLYY
jgi:hypothetical protein